VGAQVVETTRRREIEDVASGLFRERGFAGTSVRDIARALDIQGPSLYAHVASKQDLLWAIVEHMAGRFDEAADGAIVGDGTEPALGPGERLAALVGAHVAVVTEDMARAGVFIGEWRALGSERRAVIAGRRDAYERRFRAVIEDGIASGVFAPMNAAVTAAFILTAVNGIVSWYRPDGRVGPAALADTYADLALRAVLVSDVTAPGA
jgi:TetR/AcrR family transcriptional regulator, cholesterol catabolism regulator